MQALKVPKEDAGRVIGLLLGADAMDRTKKVVRQAGHVLIPLSAPLPQGIEGTELVEVEESRPRKYRRPIDRVRQLANVPAELKARLPDKWELVGDVLIFKLNPLLKDWRSEVADAYAKVLRAKAVFEDVGGIRNEFREPVLERVMGSSAETVHVENGIRYKLDASRLMFSSGNKHERMRMAAIDMSGETVVDMFAGIGYFSLPIAKYCSPERVVACEKNPLAFKYLRENALLNRLGNLRPVHADCRDLDMPGKADRVVMGYVKDTHRFLPKAFELIKDRGVIHYHEACPVELLPGRPTDRLKSEAGKRSKNISVLNCRVVKSYSPKVAHVVVDAAVS